MAFTASDICKIIAAVILPPLGVFFERGCGADLCINILLTILGFIPGIIHALYIILNISGLCALNNTFLYKLCGLWLVVISNLSFNLRMDDHHLNIPFTAKTDPLRSFDAYIPPDSPKAILVFVHGGAWRSGDKADHRTLATKLATSRTAVLVPNYRLSPSAPSSEIKFEHPAHAEDVLTFLTFLMQWEGLPRLRNISELPIFVMGHSAGAHILSAIFLDSSATTPTLTPSAEVARLVHGVVLSEGIYDIDLLLKRFPTYRDWFIAAAFGEHESYRDGSVSRLPRRSGPNDNLRWLVVHSKGDTLVDVAQSEAMRDHLRSLYGQDNVETSLDAVAVEHDDVLLDPLFLHLVSKFVGVD